MDPAAALEKIAWGGVYIFLILCIYALAETAYVVVEELLEDIYRSLTKRRA